MPMIVWLSSEEQVLTFILYMYILIVPSFQCDGFFFFLQHIDLGLIIQSGVRRGERGREGVRGEQKDRGEELKGYFTLLLQLGFWVWKFIIRSNSRSSGFSFMVMLSWLRCEEATNWYFLVKSLGSYFEALAVVSISDDTTKLNS